MLLHSLQDYPYAHLLLVSGEPLSLGLVLGGLEKGGVGAKQAISALLGDCSVDAGQRAAGRQISGRHHDCPCSRDGVLPGHFAEGRGGGEH